MFYRPADGHGLPHNPLTAIACSCATLFGLAAASVATGSDLSPVLVPSPDLAPDFEAFPRLAGTDAAASRINSELATLDTEAFRMARGCLTSPSDWSRWVTVDFGGPTFLSLTARNDYYCEGMAHPDHFAERLTFDLSTGAQVDWIALLPAELGLVRSDYGTFTSGALAGLYRYHLPDDSGLDCDGFADDPTISFEFSLSASARALTVAPLGYAYVETACAEEVAVPVAALRALGADPRLLAALAIGEN